MKVFCFLFFFSSAAFAEEVIDTRAAQFLQQEFDEQYFEINEGFEKLRHVLLHLIKTTGKMAAYCEVKEHGKIEPDPSQMIHEVLPDLLIHSLQIANYYQVNLEEIWEKRIEFLKNRSKAEVR